MNRPDRFLSDRLHDIEPFHVMELLRRARTLEAQGHDVIHMEVGEPDFNTPQPIIDAATRFLATGHVHYTSGLGMPSLREAVARFYAERFKVDIDPDRIIITPGASGALMLALAATTNPGDIWLMGDPTYPSNRHLVRAFEGSVHLLPVGPEQAYQPSAAQVTDAWQARCRGLMVASPSNPTGTIISPEQLDALATAVRAKAGVLIVDEIYQGLTYGVGDSTALQHLDDAFVINSFSKYFGMTGWRLGWLVAPEGFAREIERLAQHFFIAPSTVAQHAALAAFSPAAMAIHEERREAFDARRRVLLPGLRELGFKVGTEPQGAFYVYTDISALADDCESLAQRLIEDAGVAATPGIDFGHHRSRAHMRFAYTTGIDRLHEALERIARIVRH